MPTTLGHKCTPADPIGFSLTPEKRLHLMDELDVPDLIGALADRFQEYDIWPHEAAHITLEMLREAMTAVDAESEDFLLACTPATKN